MHLLVNVLVFQVGWFASVIGAARGVPLLGPAVVLAVVAGHLLIAARPTRELILILLAGALGAAWDSVLVSAGLVSYPSGNLVTGAAPYWIVTMWMLFATTLNVALRWLHTRLALAAALGGLSGPLTYYAGGRLGGIEFLDLVGGLTALAIGWAVMMPTLTVLSRRFDGIAVPASSADEFAAGDS